MTGNGCPRCEGCGQLADTDDREPWTAWTSLPAASRVAVTLGLVKPVPCDECQGMHPVEQAIRAALNDYYELGDAGAALDAVLDLHNGRQGGLWPYYTCGHCVEQECPVEYPCETVKAIADVLGVNTMTTPQQADDEAFVTGLATSLVVLIARWRERAAVPVNSGGMADGERTAYTKAAAELEAVLRSAT